MYHTHKATERHDKIFALLSMASDSPTLAGIKPEYDLGWGTLMKNLISFVLTGYISVDASNEENVPSGCISIDTWDEKETAVIKSKGCVLGTVEIQQDGGQNAKAIIQTSPGGTVRGSTPWRLQTSAKSIQDGDLICLLQGALKPTIIRFQEDHFIIVMIAAEPPNNIHTQNGDIEWLKLIQSVSFIRDFLLVWDWKASFKNGHNPDQHGALPSQYIKTKLENDMENSIRTWNIAQILGDVGARREAGERRQEAADFFLVAVTEKHSHSLECPCRQVPLLWASENGDAAVVGILLAKDDVDSGLKDYFQRTPLWWAAAGGHEAVVKLLLATDRVDVDVRDNFYGQTPLLQAVVGGYEGIVKLLLATDRVDVGARDFYGQTPLLHAVVGGYEGIIKLLLLATGKLDVREAMSLAVERGYEGIVKLLLATGKVDVSLLLLEAAGGGHEAVIKMLLATGNVDIRMPLRMATQRGHEGVVKLLKSHRA